MLPDSAPLILTLLLDGQSQDWFDGLRRRYFPADRVQVGAHVTMFHALPGGLEPRVVAAVRAACAGVGAVEVEVSGLRFLGRGVAFALRSPGAAAVRGVLRAEFAEVLTAQDRADWSPHVTIQNKVSGQVARETEAVLGGLAWPMGVRGVGVGVWRYLGGPWERVCAVSFG